MKLLVTTHGDFCEGILKTYRMIAGTPSNIHTLKLGEEGIDSYREKLKKWMDSNRDEYILVLCDLKGGTPYNECYRYHLENTDRIQIVSGLNLPMLIELGLTTVDSDDIQTAAITGVEIGKMAIESLEQSEDYSEDLEF